MSDSGDFWLLAPITQEQVASFDWDHALEFFRSAAESATHRIPVYHNGKLKYIAMHDGERIDAKTGLAQVECAICQKVLLLGSGPLNITTITPPKGNALITMYSCSEVCSKEADQQIRKLQLDLVTRSLEQTSVDD